MIRVAPAPVFVPAPAPVFVQPAVPAPAPPAPPAPGAPPPPVPFPSAGSAYRHPPDVLTPPTPPPPIRVDRIASWAVSRAGVQGQVVSRSAASTWRTQVTLVNASQPRLRQYVAADGAGRFDVSLLPGPWLVYTRGADGFDAYQGRIEIRDQETTRVRLVTP